jgi:hypothetical protein
MHNARPAPVSPGKWHHVVVASDYKKGQQGIYVDGARVAAAMSRKLDDWAPVGSYSKGQIDSIGARFVNNWQFFRGAIDEVRIYNRCLTAAEVLNLFRAAQTAKTADRKTAAPTTDGVIATVRRLFKELSARPAIPKQWDGKIRYCTGVNHSHHRVLIHGFSYNEPDDRPPADGRPYSVFYYDPDGRVRLVVQHIPGQAPYVSSYVVYHQNQPLARITYARCGDTFGDFVHYEQGKPFLSCRILGDGRAVLVKKLSED